MNKGTGKDERPVLDLRRKEWPREEGRKQRKRKKSDEQLCKIIERTKKLSKVEKKLLNRVDTDEAIYICLYFVGEYMNVCI